MKRRSRPIAHPRVERLDARIVLSTLTPAQLDTAYGLGAITFKSGSTTVKGDGAGQTIAIVDAYNDPNIVAELKAFDSAYGLPAANLSVVNLGSAGNVDSGWSEEAALDVEWAHVSAPGAKIVLVEATSDSVDALIAAVKAAKAIPTVSVVSMSWGTSDFSRETSLDATFTTPTGHIGITFLAAAGDQPGASWPADSPNVVAVGGTSLTVTGTGSRSTETAWTSSGGGTSRVEAEPTYQKGVQSSGHRVAVDVSAVANPNTGVLEYSTVDGGFVKVGGTSLSTPIWAGLIAIADEGRALAGKSSLDGATQTLPDLYAAPAASFNAIASSSRTAAAFNTSTGLGSPNAATLVAALVADPATGAAAISTGSAGASTVGTTTSGGTSTTTSGSTGTSQPVGNVPGYPPFGGRWGGWFGGYGGYFLSTVNQGGWSGPVLPKNSGQEAPTPLPPIVPITFSPAVPSGPSATPRSSSTTTPANPRQTTPAAPKSKPSAPDTSGAETTSITGNYRGPKDLASLASASRI